MEKGINIYKRTGGLGKINLSERSYTGLVMTGVAVGGGAALDTTYQLNSLNDALALGINPAYDVANATLVYYHIKEYFRLSPSGTLFVMLVSQSTTLTEICDVTSTYGIYALANDPLCKGKLRYIGCALNPASGYTPTVTAQMNTDVIAVAMGTYSGAVVKAQAAANRIFGMYRPGQIFVEARDFGGTAGSLIDATGANADSVQLIIAADNDIAAAQTVNTGYAAVGTALGLRSNLQVQQQLSYVAVGDVQNQSTGDFVNPGYSGNVLLSAYTQGYWQNDTYTTGTQDDFQIKGFMGLETYNDFAGVYFACDITASATTDDFNLGPNGLVVNEGARVIYGYMVPNIGIDINVQASNGNLDPLLVATWQGEINTALQTALAGNVSAVSCLIDPNQNVLSSDTITVQLVITPKAYANTITIPIGLQNPYKTS